MELKDHYRFFRFTVARGILARSYYRNMEKPREIVEGISL